MEFTRSVTPVWKGRKKEDKSTLNTTANILNSPSYNYDTTANKVEVNRAGATHTGGFTMQLSSFLQRKGYIPASLKAEAKMNFKEGKGIKVLLFLTGNINDISTVDLNKIVEKTKEICPVSNLLKTDIELEINLV
ncbi:OsmC family protein [Abyssalbus ytuae]|uniref:OsmC family protein n=1 Tax=Abyssalbus ytuae TaxID=2926907 RepID=A0A9E7D1Y2_9FLAO|nr:OsmC family protein [Abyssalbus ytuae]UOB17588.1 OsmC family protein [Abyssalbus ytuae]